MELNNSIDPNTGLPLLPKGHYWQVTPPDGRYTQSVILRKETKPEYRDVPLPRGFFRKLFLMNPKMESKLDTRTIDKVLGKVSVNPYLTEKPDDVTGYTHFVPYVDYRYSSSHVKVAQYWFKTDISKSRILECAIEVWDTYITECHEEALRTELYGNYPPKSLNYLRSEVAKINY